MYPYCRACRGAPTGGTMGPSVPPPQATVQQQQGPHPGMPPATAFGFSRGYQGNNPHPGGGGGRGPPQHQGPQQGTSVWGPGQ
jgi:hypothetical protein